MKHYDDNFHSTGGWRYSPRYGVIFSHDNIALFTVTNASDNDALVAAAAPEMLEALKVCVKELEFLHSLGITPRQLDLLIDSGYDAIEKAGGRV